LLVIKFILCLFPIDIAISKYALFRWFAAVAIGTLRVFGKDWTIQPSRDWVRLAIKALGRGTAKSSEEITRRFVQAWNPGGQSEFIPLTDDQAWGDQRHGLVLHVSPSIDL
jgi:hypothetical protein